MFTKIHFQNLRCFKDFTIETATPLTLISGRNNVGKTTALEGVFLLCLYGAPDMFFKIAGIRKHEFPAAPWQGAVVPLDPFFLWELLFHEADMSHPLRISITDDVGNDSIFSLEKDTQFSLAQPVGNTNNMLQSLPGTYVLTLSYRYNEKEEQGRFLLTQHGLTLNYDAPPSLPRPPVTVYLGSSANIPQQLVADWFSKVEVGGQKAWIIDTLRLLDAEIEDLFTATVQGMGYVYARRKSGRPLPVSMMGDGINKLLRYLLAMTANPGCLLLVDEIETGLHYTFYPQLWQLIASLAKQTNSQIIATTHSDECIHAAAEGTAKVDPALLSYIRLGKESDVIVPYYFTNNDLAFALEREMEVR